jgi:hypothetical protein
MNRLSVFPMVVGSGRSGTTLLRAIFDSHPEMAVLHESHFLGQMARIRDVYERTGRFAADRFLSDLRERFPFEAHGLSQTTIADSFERDPPRDFADAVRQIFALYARSKGKARYADKTPEHVRAIPRLASLFPEARFVHVIRDGRDVALSLLDMGWGPQTVAAAALYWRQRVELGIKAGRVLPSRYREVKYEDLVADPEGVVRSLCEFLELSFDGRMLRYFERAEEVVAETGFPHQHRRLTLPPAAGLRDWRRSMASEDVALFEVLAGDVLGEVGYEQVLDQISTRMRLKARRRAAASHLRRIPHRARRAVGGIGSLFGGSKIGRAPIDARISRESQGRQEEDLAASSGA